MNCKRCGHEDYTHLCGEGQCQAFIIKWEGSWHEIEIAPGLKGYNQDVEYEGPCPCEAFTTTKKPMKRRVFNLDNFLS